jgi:hypothetical protein
LTTARSASPAVPAYIEGKTVITASMPDVDVLAALEPVIVWVGSDTVTTTVMHLPVHVV